MANLEFLKTQTLLFVENDDVDRKFMLDLIGNLFKEIIQASNGQEGFEKFKESYDANKKIDLVISNINLPLMNGFELFENIRKLDKQVSLIYNTGKVEVETFLKAIDLNVSAYVIKPIDTKILMKKLLEASEKRFFQNELYEKQNELKKYIEAVDYVALIYKMDGNGNITFANNSFLEISGYTLEELKEINFDNLIHPDIPKEYLDKTWASLKKGEIWNGNTKFITKDKESFYLKNTIFKSKAENHTEYITIGFSTTKESAEKREFQKKVIKAIQEFNKKEFSYRKTIEELTERNQKLEAYIPLLKTELEEQKAKTISRQRQLDHYEMQMHNIDEKYQGNMVNKIKEADECTKNLGTLKQEKDSLKVKLKEANEEIEATKKELKLLMQSNEQKLKKINDLMDVIKSLEKKIDELLHPEEFSKTHSSKTL